MADDEPQIRRIAGEVLIRSGQHVDAAEDGVIAWDALLLNSYDNLVTNQDMPKLTGVELVKKLRAVHSALPLILVTGAMATEELERRPLAAN